MWPSRCALIAALIILAACGEDKDQALAECKFEARKMYPSDDGVLPSARFRSAVQECMGVKGFVRDAGPSECSLFNVEMQAACYARR